MPRHSKPHNYVIRNQTPFKVTLRAAHNEQAGVSLTLAPLQTRRIGDDPMALLPAAAAAAHADQAVDWESEPLRSSRLLWATWLAVIGISSALLASMIYLISRNLWALLVGGVIALLCAVGGFYGVGRGRKHAARSVTTSSATRPPFSPTPLRDSAWDVIRDFVIATAQGLVVVVVVVVAVAAPATAIYYGTELSSVIIFKPWNHPRLIQGPNAQYIVVGRLLQLFLLILVSLVPALMFFQFDREKLSTLVDRWLHAIFRLDPTLTSVADVDAKYGRRVEEFYGATLGLGVNVSRKRMRDRSPVVMTTLLIAIGWILVLLNQQQDARTLPTFQDLFRPSPTPMTLAFLGAYFLSVQVVLRGYVRGDLKPKTYNVITVRILMAIVLAWVMQALWGNSELILGLAFLSGIVPNTVLRWIRETIEHLKNSSQTRLQVKYPAKGSETAPAAGDELSEKSPLSQLDDVDIYDRTRLEEEGITSVQALARHDLIDLILSSRIPVPRLIDWMDQAVLHQHVPTEIPKLRALGIRTATDFLQAVKNEPALRELTAALGDNSAGVPIQLLRCVLERDEWVPYLQNWRQHDGTEAVTEKIYHGGTSVTTRPTSAGTAAGQHAQAAVRNGARARHSRGPAAARIILARLV
jgi:hypothetical protein